MRCDGQRLVPALMTLCVWFLVAPPVAAAGPEIDNTAKAPKTIPSQESDIQRRPPAANRLDVRRSLSTEAVTDTTPPGPPLNLVASAAQLASISARWDPAQDPESGIWDYAFAVGTHRSSAEGPLDNARGWQITYDTHISVPLALDPNVTYYVSVAAINNAQMWGPIVTSNAVHPVWAPIGQPGTAMTIAFADAGYDTKGNPTAGWSPAQVATMRGFFDRMYPILLELYGPPAVSYTLTVVRDLRYSGSNIFIPSADEIRMSDTFIPQLFTHELIHAFRNDYILSTDADWGYDPTLSGFEEGFAQGVSYDAMNTYVARHPTDALVPAASLWDSSYEWDYDFQNMPELRGTDFWSTSGATGLLWLKYEMAAAAIRKINLESPGFYQRFNEEYYRRINANPSTRSSRALIVDVIKTVVPTIEGMPADAWVNAQHIFYAKNVYGEKIFFGIQDYPATDFYAFDYIHFLDTMPCGSEWACYDGQQWVYHRLNGSRGTGTLLDWNGQAVWAADLLIEPVQNPSDGYFGFGADAVHLTTAASQFPWPGGDAGDFVFDLTPFGLYRFTSTFTDALTGRSATNQFYRPIGDPIRNGFAGVWGGVIGYTRGTIFLDRDGFPPEPGLPVVNGAFAGPRSWTGVPNARTGGRDTTPGKVRVTFVDGETGVTHQAQRNVGYGNWNGSQMFLFDFAAAAAAPPPTVQLVSPASGAMVTGLVAVSADASGGTGISRVEFYRDAGVPIGAAAAPPYTVSWNTAGLGQGLAYSLYARAVDSAGNSASSAPVSVTLRDTTPPAVSITSPAGGTLVNGSVTVVASASDNVGVARTELYVDGVLLATGTSSPLSAPWNTASASGGSHTLTARAYDQANNATTSAAVSVIKDATFPTVSLTKPSANASVSGMVTVTATASDNFGVSQVAFYVDGTLLAADTSSPYSATWNADVAAVGPHTLTATAYDKAGNSTASTARTVTVVDKVKPTVAITAPANSAIVSRSSTVAIGATAADNRSVQRVEFYVNNALTCTAPAAPYTCLWSVPSKINVTYTLKARAYDGAGNKTDATVKVTAR